MAGLQLPESEDQFFGAEDSPQTTSEVASAEEPEKIEPSKNDTQELETPTKESEPQGEDNWIFKELEKQDEEEKEEREQVAQPQQTQQDPQVSEHESELMDLMWENMEDEFQFPRLNKENRPKTIEGFSQMVKSLIDANRKPQYSHKEVENFDKFVSAGGDPYAYMRGAAEISFGNVTLTDDRDRQMVIAEKMAREGNSQNTIAKAIDGYTRAGALKEVADDALKILQQHEAYEKDAAIKQQEYDQREYNKAVQQDISRTVGYVQESPEIMGLKLSRKEKDDLLMYMYQEDKNGYTQFAKDLMGDVGNAVHAAFLLKNGPSILNRVSVKAQTSARDKLRAKIAQDNMRQHVPGPKQRKIEEKGRIPMWKQFEID